MIWILTIAVVALGCLTLGQQQRIRNLETLIIDIRGRLEAYSSPEYHRMQYEMGATERMLHDVVLTARARGNLDLANKMMEFQHWADCDYESHWLDGMFRGLP